MTGSSATGGKESTGFIHDYYTAKYAAADGALLWEMRYNGPANGDDYPSSLALGPNGMVVVAGSSARSSGYDYATVVYREGLPPVAIERVPTGVRLRFTGIAGRGYNLQGAFKNRRKRRSRRAPLALAHLLEKGTPASPENTILSGFISGCA